MRIWLSRFCQEGVALRARPAQATPSPKGKRYTHPYKKKRGNDPRKYAYLRISVSIYHVKAGEPPTSCVATGTPEENRFYHVLTFRNTERRKRTVSVLFCYTNNATFATRKNSDFGGVCARHCGCQKNPLVSPKLCAKS